MSCDTTSLAKLIKHNPEAAKREVIAALRRSGGNASRAAHEFGVSERVARVWAVRFGLRDMVFEDQQIGWRERTSLALRQGRRRKWGQLVR